MELIIQLLFKLVLYHLEHKKIILVYFIMISLGQKRGMPNKYLGMQKSNPSHSLGQKVVGASKNYTLDIKNQQVHHSPIEKLARSNQALGQYA